MHLFHPSFVPKETGKIIFKKRDWEQAKQITRAYFLCDDHDHKDEDTATVTMMIMMANLYKQREY